MKFFKPTLLALIVMIPCQTLPMARALYENYAQLRDIANNTIGARLKKCTPQDYAIMAVTGVSLAAAGILWKINKSLKNKYREYDSLNAIETRIDGLMETYAQEIALADAQNQAGLSTLIKTKFTTEEAWRQFDHDLESLRTERYDLTSHINAHWVKPEHKPVAHRAHALLKKINILMSSLEMVYSLSFFAGQLANAENFIAYIEKKYHHELRLLEKNSESQEERIEKVCDYLNLKLRAFNSYHLESDIKAINKYYSELRNDSARLGGYHRAIVESALSDSKNAKEKQSLVTQVEVMLTKIDRMMFDFDILSLQQDFLILTRSLQYIPAYTKALYKQYLAAVQEKATLRSQKLLQEIVSALPLKSDWQYRHPYEYGLAWFKLNSDHFEKAVKAMSPEVLADKGAIACAFAHEVIKDGQEVLTAIRALAQAIPEAPQYMCEVPYPAAH